MKYFAIAVLMIVAGCSTQKPLPASCYPVSIDHDSASRLDDMSWWAYRFRIPWPENDDKPDFAVDLLLAHAIVRPVLQKNSEKLLMWRFHRRAARKPPGHQFSFLFYADRDTAIEVINNLDNDPLLARAGNAGLINSTSSTKTEITKKMAAEDYSDPSWSPQIQRTWPFYIMGVSAFWLALIDEIKSEQTYTNTNNAEQDVDEVRDMLEIYRQVDEKIAEIWKDEGQHALLHHLSAVFGYKPMWLKKEVIY
jgi:hypothetical protein